MTVKALKRQRADQAQARLLLGAEYNAELDLIFATHTGEPLDWQNIAHQYFRPILRKAKLPIIRPYDLRHTAATILLAAGEHPKDRCRASGPFDHHPNDGHLQPRPPRHAGWGGDEAGLVACSEQHLEYPR